MAVNLLSYLQEQFTPSVVDQLSSHLNESPTNTRKAIDGVLPAVLGGMAQRVQESGGASDIVDLLKDGNYGNTPLDISQVIGSRGDEQAAAATGSSLLDRIFGDDTDEVASAVALHSGVQQPSALALMGLAGSVLMGILGRQAQDKGLSATNLTTLLAGQADYIRTSLPAGLASLSGVLNLDKMRTEPGESIQGTTTMTSTPVSPDIPLSPQVERRRENVTWLRWVLFAVGALILFLIVQKCRQNQSGTEGVYTDTTSRAEPNAVEDRSPSTRENIEDANGSTRDTAAGPFKRP
ncbi:DUF937 domain-containing protein [Nibrella saemangeumensis]